MKKILIILFVLFASSSLYAQKGSIYAGGAVGFGNNSWKVGPEAGTWLSNDLQLGAVLAFEGSSNAGQDKSRIAPHLYFRKWWSVSEKFSLYAGINTRLVSTTDQADISSSYFDAFLDAGMSFSLAERWGMVGRIMSLGLIQEDFQFDFNMSPQSLFNVGIYYTIKQ